MMQFVSAASTNIAGLVDAVAADIVANCGLPSPLTQRHYITPATVTPELCPMLSIYPGTAVEELLATNSDYTDKHELTICYFLDFSSVLTTAQYDPARAREALLESERIRLRLQTYGVGIPGLPGVQIEAVLGKVRRGMTQVFGGIWAAEFILSIDTWSDSA